MIMAIDDDGISLRYTTRQRLFESKLMRYQQVLQKEKRGEEYQT